MKRSKAKRLKVNQGTALVEMAIVLPLLLILTLGMIEYGWLFLQAQRITNAARQGARTSAMAGADETDGVNALVAALGTYLDNKITAGGGTKTVTIYAAGDAGSPDPNNAVVEAKVTLPTAGILIVHAPGLIPVPSQLRGEVVMAKEGG